MQEHRENLEALSTAPRKIFIESILEQTVIERITNMETESPVAIVEGIRGLVDIGTLLEKLRFRLTYLVIDSLVAYERM